MDSATYESFLIKAAAKAFNKMFPDHPSHVSRVVSGGSVLFSQAHEQTLSSLSQGASHEGVLNFSKSLPAGAITVT